ncbi:hypothetical protein PROFUN_13974 [Planoprotostelium fungivorum]|uniref:Uncharacterized protein n=1 Tax=Planoprotostelium fungivorum TaxID=1890364 RepID=A0A2P6N2Q1_9EUKA|nr:hypothetical protein PROFUN_13974 [Planoprotostelium fungivorum]
MRVIQEGYDSSREKGSKMSEDAQHNSIQEEHNLSETPPPRPPIVEERSVHESSVQETSTQETATQEPATQETSTQEPSSDNANLKDEESQKARSMKKSGEPRKVAVCGLCHKSKLGHLCSRQDCPGPEYCHRPDLHRRKYVKRISEGSTGTSGVPPYYFEMTGVPTPALPSVNKPQVEPTEISKPLEAKIEDATSEAIEHASNLLSNMTHTYVPTPTNHPIASFNPSLVPPSPIAPSQPPTTSHTQVITPPDPNASTEEEEHYQLFRDKVTQRRALVRLQELWAEEYQIMGDLNFEFLARSKMYSFLHRLRLDYITGLDLLNTRSAKRKLDDASSDSHP